MRKQKEKLYSYKTLSGTIVTKDSKGRKVSEARPRLFGGYSIHDAKGKKIGSSTPNLFGGSTLKDADNKKIGTEYNTLTGSKTVDNQGNKISETLKTISGYKTYTDEDFDFWK